MERGLRGKVAALGAAVVLCAGGSLLGSSPQDTAAVVPVPAAGISAVQTRGVKVYVSGAVAKPGLYEIPAGSRATAAIAAAGTAAELTALPGVGDITAQRILEYRAAHGFASIEDVMKVKGIGKAKFSKMQPYLEL